MSKIFLGIDTSNYTTSAALCVDGEIAENFKILLSVSKGERGLRQSDALFQHTKNIPLLMERVRGALGGRPLSGVGVSERPRNLDGSYMPCFLAGLSAAESISAAAGLPIYRFSHQCGHVMAALYSSGASFPAEQEFGAFHVSGGTTELLHIRSRSEKGFDAHLVGGTKDLNAGQAVDRIGVAMGLDFPAGPALESLALQNNKKIPRPRISGDGLSFHLSGLENLALKLYKDTSDAPLTAAFVLDYIARALEFATNAFRQEYGNLPILFAGGVMSNGIIRSYLSRYDDTYFATPAFSADNAAGIALLTAAASE